MPSLPRDWESWLGWLIDRGLCLGFHPEANYISQDGATADVAWVLNPGQIPLFTFTIEEADPMRLIASSLQWSGSSTEPRSWIHIGVLLEGSVEEMGFRLPRRLRIYGPTDLDRLEVDFKQYTSELVRLMCKYLKISTSDRNLRVSIKALAESTIGWPRGQPDTRIDFEAVATTSGERLNFFAAETLEDDEADEITLTPSRKVAPLDVQSGDVIFEGALMRLIEADAVRLLLSSEHRNLPFTFRFSLPRYAGSGSVGLWFDADKSNLPQALEFLALAEATTSSGIVELMGPSGEVAFFKIARGSY